MIYKVEQQKKEKKIKKERFEIIMIESFIKLILDFSRYRGYERR